LRLFRDTRGRAFTEKTSKAKTCG